MLQHSSYVEASSVHIHLERNEECLFYLIALARSQLFEKE